MESVARLPACCTKHEPAPEGLCIVGVARQHRPILFHEDHAGFSVINQIGDQIAS